MFSINKRGLVKARQSCGYAQIGNNLYISYNSPIKFNASLNILTAKNDVNSSYSLVFTFEDQSSYKAFSHIYLSLTKIANDSFIFNTASNEYKFNNAALIVKGKKSRELLATIEKRTASLLHTFAECMPYLTDPVVLAHSKKLLEDSAVLSKVFFRSPITSETLFDLLKQIANLLKLENAEFNNLIKVNQSKLSSTR